MDIGRVRLVAAEDVNGVEELSEVACCVGTVEWPEKMTVGNVGE